MNLFQIYKRALALLLKEGWPVAYLALANAAIESGFSRQGDAFPTSGGVNRLPNFRERYDALRAAIQTGGFDDRTESKLLDQLEQGFRHTFANEG